MIWPFKEKKKKVKVPELSEIRIENKKYEPQADITPQEVALLLPVFMATWGLSKKEWIKKHNLSRHFVKVNDD